VDVVPTAGSGGQTAVRANLVDGVVQTRRPGHEVGVAMMITAFLRVKAEGPVPRATSSSPCSPTRSTGRLRHKFLHSSIDVFRGARRVRVGV
jgi:hypothetical protein